MTIFHNDKRINQEVLESLYPNPEPALRLFIHLNTETQNAILDCLFYAISGCNNITTNEEQNWLLKFLDCIVWSEVTMLVWNTRYPREDLISLRMRVGYQLMLSKDASHSEILKQLASQAPTELIKNASSERNSTSNLAGLKREEPESPQDILAPPAKRRA